VRIKSVGTQSNEFDTSFLELGFKISECAELEITLAESMERQIRCFGIYLGSANWGEILRMRKEHDPIVANEFMKLDRALSCIRLEIRGSRSESQLFLINSLDGTLTAHFNSFSRWRRNFVRLLYT
jgi:hypothetical protein